MKPKIQMQTGNRIYKKRTAGRKVWKEAQELALIFSSVLRPKKKQSVL